jgi:hypothetical protein
MPNTKANAKTQLQATTLNPYASVAVAGGQQVSILATFDGVSPDLPGLLDVIETKYGAGKVTAENDTTGRGVVRLRIIP